MSARSWLGAAILLAAFLYIPLSAWGATGSWRRAWQAAWQYLAIMGALVVVGCGLALLSAASEHGFASVWQFISGR